MSDFVCREASWYPMHGTSGKKSIWMLSIINTIGQDKAKMKLNEAKKQKRKTEDAKLKYPISKCRAIRMKTEEETK